MIKLEIDSARVPWYFVLQYAACVSILGLLAAGTVIIQKLMIGMERWEE